MIKIRVQIPGLEKRRRSIGLLHIVAGFFLIANADGVYQSDPQNGYLLLFPLMTVAAVSLLYGALRQRIDAVSKFNFGVRLLQAFVFLSYAIAFVQSGYGVRSLGLAIWVFIALMLAFSERIALQEQNVVFTDKGFDFPAGYRRKEITWNAVADVTLRPDFLTIHYRNNRFLQFELKQPISDAEMQHLQDFCRRQIERNVVAS